MTKKEKIQSFLNAVSTLLTLADEQGGDYTSISYDLEGNTIEVIGNSEEVCLFVDYVKEQAEFCGRKCSVAKIDNKETPREVTLKIK